jgi:addiction module RelE/StbE family toxin
MRYKVELTPKANQDLAEIITYIAQDKPKVAEEFGRKLVGQALLLSTFPFRGSKMRGNRKARKLVYRKKYLIIYTVNKRQKTVGILRFLHGAQIK